MEGIQAKDIAGARFGRIEVVMETGSTNADVLARAKAGEPEGLVLVAEAQTAGHGRLQRPWIDEPGRSILCSVLVRPKLDASHAQLLTVAGGLAALKAIIDVTNLSIELKWPNDLMVADRKLGGILTESVLEGASVACCVVGMGLNVNWSTESFPAEIRSIATSLSAELGREVDRNQLLEAYLRRFEEYVELAENAPESLIREYKTACSTIGRRVSIVSYSKRIEGIAVGVDLHGQLLVSTDDEQVAAVDSGDVTEFADG